MKIWQLAVCLENEEKIFNEYFKDVDLVSHGQDDIAEAVTLNALSKSNKFFNVTSDKYLRLAKGEDKSETSVSVIDAYKRFGAVAITEVFDYGSFKLP